MEWVTGGNGDEKRQSSAVSWINVNTAPCNYCGWSSPFRSGWGKHATPSQQVQSNENAQVTGAFNCIYGKAKSEDCRGLLRMKARPYKWKIWFSLNIAFRLLICRGRWDHHRNTTWADGFIWTCHENTWVLLLRRITWYTGTAAQMKFLMLMIRNIQMLLIFIGSLQSVILSHQIMHYDDLFRIIKKIYWSCIISKIPCIDLRLKYNQAKCVFHNIRRNDVE